MSDDSPKRLTRSRRYRMLWGVAGGFATYFNMDPTIFRLLFVGAVILTGIAPGVAFYIICAVIIPEEPVSA
jgi:phage shock protein C